jgi:transcriptional regulator with XRE-family HTH domain
LTRVAFGVSRPSPVVTAQGHCGGLLRAHRTRVGLAQQELASRAVVRLRALRDIEHDRVGRPRLDSLGRSADALKLADGEPAARVRHRADPTASASCATTSATRTGAQATGRQHVTWQAALDIVRQTAGAGPAVRIPRRPGGGSWPPPRRTDGGPWPPSGRRHYAA